MPYGERRSFRSRLVLTELLGVLTATLTLSGPVLNGDMSHKVNTGHQKPPRFSHRPGAEMGKVRPSWVTGNRAEKILHIPYRGASF